MSDGIKETANVSAVNFKGFSSGYFRSRIKTENVENTTTVKVIMKIVIYFRSVEEVIPKRLWVISVALALLCTPSKIDIIAPANNPQRTGGIILNSILDL